MNFKQKLENKRLLEKIAMLQGQLTDSSKQQSMLIGQLDRARRAKFKPIKPAKLRPKLRGDKVRVTIGDVHGVNMDRKAVAAFLADVRRIQPDEIFLMGDIVNCGTFLAQHHTLGYVAETAETWENDVAASNWFLDELRAAAPNSMISYIEGNHECLTSDHEVLTSDGWVPIANVSTEHTVATLGWGNITEWQKPKAVLKKRFCGDLFVSDANAFYRTRMTPGHRVCYYGHYLGDIRYRTAEEVFSGRNSNFTIPVSGLGKRDDMDGITDDEIRLLGWLLTDGCINGAVWLYQSKPDRIEEIRAMLDRIGLKYSFQFRKERELRDVRGVKIKKSLPQGVFRIASKHKDLIARLFDLGSWHHGVKYTKAIPRSVDRYSHRQFSVLLDAIIAGDGHATSRQAASIYGQAVFLERLQALCVVNGVRALLRSKTRKGVHSHYVLYAVRTPATKVETEMVKREAVDCDVYCLTTANSNFFVRRKGSVHVTGNCRIERWCISVTMLGGGHASDAHAMLDREGIPARLNLKKREIPFYRMAECYDGLTVPGFIKRGKIFYTHGSFVTSKHATRDIQSKVTGNVVFANTHRSQTEVVRKVNVGVIGAWNPGCCCLLQPLWLNTNPSDWTLGYGLEFIAASENFLHINMPLIGESLLTPFLASANESAEEN